MVSLMPALLHLAMQEVAVMLVGAVALLKAYFQQTQQKWASSFFWCSC
jgi:hypothetical protein